MAGLGLPSHAGSPALFSCCRAKNLDEMVRVVVLEAEMEKALGKGNNSQSEGVEEADVPATHDWYQVVQRP